MVSDEHVYVRQTTAWLNVLSQSFEIGKLRWLQLGDQTAGHVIVDAKGGGIRFHHSLREGCEESPERKSLFSVEQRPEEE